MKVKMTFVLLNKNSEFYLIEEKEFSNHFEIFRKENTPNVYNDFHVRLNDSGKKLREEYFYYYQLLEVRSRWTPGDPMDVKIVGFYIWDDSN